MIREQAIAFFLFVIVAAITPGPSNLIMTSVGATVGVLRGIPSASGAAIGMGLIMFLMAFGLGSLVLENPLIVQGVRWCGLGFLLWLSWKIATAGRSEVTGEKEYVGFWGAAAFQWVNPKSWLVTAGAASTYLQPEAGRTFDQSVYFGLLFVFAALPCFLVWVAFGAALQRFLHTERASRAFNVAMGTLLAGSVILFIW